MQRRKCLTDLPTGPLETIGGFLQGKKDIVNFTSCSKVVYHRIKGAPELWPELDYTVACVDTPEELEKLESFLKWLIKYHPCKTLSVTLLSVAKELSTMELENKLSFKLHQALLECKDIEHLTLKAPFAQLYGLVELLGTMKGLKTAAMCIKCFSTSINAVNHASLEELSLEVKAASKSWSSGARVWLPKGLRKLSITADRHCSKLVWNAFGNPASHCTRLADINLSGSDACQFCKGSFSFLKHLAAMPSVTALDLSSSGMKAIPEQLGFVTSLQRLNLSGNSNLAGEGFEIFHLLIPLKQLSSLKLQNCGFDDELPFGLLGLADSLRDLDVSDNDLGSIDTLFALANLTSLDVSSNYELYCNGIDESFPPPFPLLQRLSISHTEIENSIAILKLASTVQVLQVREQQLFHNPTLLLKLLNLRELRVKGNGYEGSHHDEQEHSLLQTSFLETCEAMPRLKKVVVLEPWDYMANAGKIVRNLMRFVKNRPGVELHVVASNNDKLYEF